MEISIKDVPAGSLKQKNFEGLKFGELFTDRMFVMEYSPKTGWTNARIEAFHNFSLSPANDLSLCAGNLRRDEDVSLQGRPCRHIPPKG